MEFRVRLPNGELVIPFKDADDLANSIGALDIEKIVNIVGQKFANLLEKPKAKTGLEEIYEIGPDGLPILLHPPKSKIEAIGIALYASAPKGLSGPALERASRVRNPLQGFVNQDRYRKYFGRDREGKVILTHDGTRWVTEEILPKMKRPQ